MTDRAHQNALIVNDEPETTRLVLQVLAGHGIRGTTCRDVPSTLEKLNCRQWDLVLADLDVVNGQRLDLLHAAKQHCPETPVVLMSGRGSTEQAVRAMRQGADDFLLKPIDEETLKTIIEELLPNHKVPLAAAAEQDTRYLYRIVGVSDSLMTTIATAKKVAPTSAPVYVAGESGTGKELVSFLIHRASKRWQGPYIQVNCAALSESLLESELFGHERGAFTGAYSQRKGRFERAHGGTLLLDEISETPARLQAELLRVLEQQDFERVGGSELVRVNVRVISTSNKDLSKQVEKGHFREDLYYRLCGVTLTISPLRERKEDIPPLVWHFVNMYAREIRRKITALDVGMMELFSGCHWPGNVRQLRNLVRAALIMGEGTTLSLEGIPGLRNELQTPTAQQAKPLSLKELERCAIFEALRRTKSHQVKAAKLLGITDRTLREKLRKYRQDAQGALQASGDRRWVSDQG